MQAEHRDRFDSNILMQFRKAAQIALKTPAQLPFFTKALLNQSRAVSLRKKLSKQGVQVPPLLIISITNRCNLNCRGCYSKVLHNDTVQEFSDSRFQEILTEAVELGISTILLAGGEPLVRRDILDVAALFPQIIFPIFTNAMLLDAEYIQFFKKHPHLIPVVSLEGREVQTDERRGDGVYANFQKVCKELKEKKLFWGISLTLTSETNKLLLSQEFLKEYLELGCRLFFFVEYVPIDPNSKHLVLTPLQKARVQPTVDMLMEKLPGLFIAFPGDEDQYGGCLAAGRGFMHINPSGMVEPCPFAPFSDVDIRFSSLREALDSKLMAKIRAKHHLLKETEGGCALWANREEVIGVVDGK
jgi:MoaA/NifB/PqqE/SkfB family radical SAM enzyme